MTALVEQTQTCHPTFIAGSIFLFFFLTFSAFALSPEIRLSDESKEQRAQKIFTEVRCLVCGGQSIESSNTEFSFEMRKFIREKIKSGESDQKIREDLVDEFGEEILINPLLTGKRGFLLWLLPLIFSVLVGLFALKKLSYPQFGNKKKSS